MSRLCSFSARNTSTLLASTSFCVRFTELNEADGSIHSRFEGEIAVAGEKKSVVGVGNGPIDE